MATKSTQPNKNEKRIRIDRLMKKLAKQRRIFYSEADFQFALGWLIQQENPDYKVRFEYSPSFDNSMHIDILVITDDQKWIPIELKYKTQRVQIECGDEKYSLKKHGAKNENCYRYVKDIERIETIALKSEKFIEGYAIMLTNDATYIKEPLTKKANYSDFSIHNGACLNREYEHEHKLKWKDESKVKKEMKSPIKLNGKYHMKWNDYSIIDNHKIDNHKSISQFWFLVSEIKKEGLL